MCVCVNINKNSKSKVSMATKAWILKLLLFTVQLALCSGNAKLQLRFDKYSNPSQYKENGYCCDGELRGINCTGTCDYSARVCLGSRNETPCDLLSFDTGAFELAANGDVTFVSGRPNPVLFDLTTWTGFVFITVEILDLDTSAMETVDKFSFLYTLQSPVRNRLAGSSDYTDYTHLGQRKVEPTSLSVSVNVMCDRFYFSDNCSVNCVPSDDCNGHYECDTTTGERTCLKGWGGSACSVQLSSDHGCNEDQVCYHGSTCVPYGGNLFYCCCAVGYTGVTCETDLDECVSQPCQNGGNCSQGDPGNYQCQCPPRYKGRNCQESKTCADNPCLNNGNCNSILAGSVETFFCICPLGFTGGVCQSVIPTTTITTPTTTTTTTTTTTSTAPSTTTSSTTSMSTPVLCSENLYGPDCSVFCSAKNDCTGHYSCNRLTGLPECHPGWHGDKCISRTEPYPGCQCQNGGECFLDTCCCPQNFTGLLCETPVSHCRTESCLNGGTCYEEASGFQCACAAGFVGVRCETVMCPRDYFGPSCTVYCKEEDNCETGQYTCDSETGARVCRFGWKGPLCSERDPAAQHEVACPNSECRNNGLCANNTCCCRPGFTGSLCHIEILECASSPCQNGARCRDLIADYLCECKRGFAGKNCESRVEPTPSDVTSPVPDPCYGVTCFNKGTCVNNGTAKSLCLCPEGFSGEFCQDVVSHMTSTQNPLLPPCQKNYYGLDCATFCKEEHSCDMGHYYCDPQSGAKLCHNGWSGPQCLTRTVAPNSDPECPQGIPCLNGGSCFNGTCCCRDRFSGKYCQVEELPCARSPCLNGRCLDLLSEYKCLCYQGYEGARCEIFIGISSPATIPSLATDANIKETKDVSSTPNTSPGMKTNPGPSSSPIIETSPSAGMNTFVPGSSSEGETSSLPETETSSGSRLVMETSSGSSSSSGIETSSTPGIETSSVQSSGPGLETSSDASLGPGLETGSSYSPAIETSSGQSAENSSILISGSGVTQEIVSVTSPPAVACGLQMCYNDGTCYSLLNGQKICSCPPGFEGDQCEVVVGLETSSTTTGPTDSTNENTFSSSSAPTLTESTSEKTGILIGTNISTERSWASGVTELASPSTVDASSRSDSGTLETTVVMETSSSNDSATPSVTNSSSSAEQTTASVSAENSFVTQPGGDQLITTGTYDTNTSGGGYNSTGDIFGVDTSKGLNNATVPPSTSGTSASETVFDAGTSTTKSEYDSEFDSSPDTTETTSNGTVSDSDSSGYPSSTDDFKSTLSAIETGLGVNATNQDSSSPATTPPTTSFETETMIVTRNITGGVSDVTDLTSDHLPSESNFVHGQTTSDYLGVRTSGGITETTAAVRGDTSVHTDNRTTEVTSLSDDSSRTDSSESPGPTTMIYPPSGSDFLNNSHSASTGDRFGSDESSLPSSILPSVPSEISDQPTTEVTSTEPGALVHPMNISLIGPVELIDEGSLMNIVETALNETIQDIDCCVGTKKISAKTYIGPNGILVQKYNIVFVSTNGRQPQYSLDEVLAKINQSLETTPPFSSAGTRVYTGQDDVLYPLENKYEIDVVGDVHDKELWNMKNVITYMWRNHTPDCQCDYEVPLLIAKRYMGDYGTRVTRLTYFLKKDGQELSPQQTQPPKNPGLWLDNQQDSFSPVYEGITSVPFDRHYTVILNTQLKMVTDVGVQLLDNLQNAWMTYLKTKVDICSAQQCSVSVRYSRPELFYTENGNLVNSLDYFVVLNGSVMDATKLAGPTDADLKSAQVPLCDCSPTPLPYVDVLGLLTWSETNSFITDVVGQGSGSAIVVSRQSFLDRSGKEVTRIYYKPAKVTASERWSPPPHDVMENFAQSHRIVLPSEPLRRQYTLVLEDVVTEGENYFLQTYLKQAWETANNGDVTGGILATKRTIANDWEVSTPERIPGTALSINITSVDSSYLANNKSIPVTVVKYTVNVVKADSSITITEEPSKVSLLQGFSGSSYSVCACVPLKTREIITLRPINPDNTSILIASIEKAWKKENPDFTGGFTIDIREIYVNQTGTNGENVTYIIYTVIPDGSSSPTGFTDLDLKEPSNQTIQAVFDEDHIGHEVYIDNEPSEQFPWWIPVGIILGLLLLVIIVIVFVCIIRDLRRRESRNIKQKPEHINGYDREHFSSEPEFDNPSFAVDDPDLNDSKSSTYFVNVDPDHGPQPNDRHRGSKTLENNPERFKESNFDREHFMSEPVQYENDAFDKSGFYVVNPDVDVKVEA